MMYRGSELMNYRHLFDGIETSVKIKDGSMVVPINFDNGATTPPFKYVNRQLKESISLYGPIGRGAGQKGDYCTEKYEESRKKILEFFNLSQRNEYTVIYVKSTTEGLNLLSNVLINDKKEKVLTTRMEHHANDLPWRYNSDVEYVEVDSNGRLDLKQLEEKLSQNTFSYVSITGASNVTGYINPINSIAKIVHRYGAKLIVDGAQLVPHRKINMTGNHPDESIDFLVFSAHKMYAPYGVGVIVGLSKELNTLPFLKGGGAVKTVSDSDVIWKPAPERHEAGTQNFLGIVALTASIDMIKKIGYNHIVSHENYLRNYLIRELRKIPNVILYGDYNNIDDRLGVISFNIKDKDYDYVSHKLADDFGIATRYGKFCAHPYVNRLLNVDDDTVIEKSLSNEKSTGMIRLSLGLYNTLCEAKCVVNAISYIANN